MPESLGTIPAFLAHPGDRIGMHPLARVKPPRAAFAGLAPDTIAVGHGAPVIGGAAADMRQALEGARTQIPSALLTTVRSLRRR